MIDTTAQLIHQAIELDKAKGLIPDSLKVAITVSSPKYNTIYLTITGGLGSMSVYTAEYLKIRKMGDYPVILEFSEKYTPELIRLKERLARFTAPYSQHPSEPSLEKFITSFNIVVEIDLAYARTIEEQEIKTFTVYG